VQLIRADVDLVARLHERRPADSLAVDERAVGGLEVDEGDPVAGREDPGVVARDPRLRDHQVVDLGAADGDLALVERAELRENPVLGDRDAEYGMWLSDLA